MIPTDLPNDQARPVQSLDVEFPSLDGTILRGRFWTTDQPRGVLLIAHGLGEHGGSYRRLGEPLASRLAIDVLATDFRGSGRSTGKRGVIRSYSELSDDLVAANGWVARERPGLPRFLLGHSNGGLLALKTDSERDLGLTGLIVSNPSIKLRAHVPIWKRLVGEILLRIAPGMTLTTGLNSDQLTKDPVVIAEIESDLLRHDRISPPLFFGMIAAGPIVMALAEQFRTPILMILGQIDPIIDPTTNQRFFEKLGSSDKTLRVYPGMKHEPLNEIGREQVVSDLSDWIVERLNRLDPIRRS